MNNKLKSILETISVILCVIMFCFGCAFAFVYPFIWADQHAPKCVESKVVKKCTTSRKCKYPMQLPGFCITEEVIECRDVCVCTKYVKNSD